MPQHNINEFDQIYRRTLRGAGTTGSVVRLKLKRIRAKTLKVLTHVTVENQTNAYTKCRLGINAGGKDHYLDELDAPAAAELAVSRSDALLGEGDVFFAELTGTTDDDVLVLTCVGWEKWL